MNAHSPVQPPQAAEAAAASGYAETLPPAALAYRAAMRKLAGAVSILTVGAGENRTGLTATSVSCLSVDPPTLIISLNRTSSAISTLASHRHFAINVLRAHHQPLADQFAGKGGMKGHHRYHGAEWTKLETGAPVLTDALASFDCELEEAIQRHSHVIVLGRVVATRVTEAAEPLLYWAGAYRNLVA